MLTAIRGDTANLGHLQREGEPDEEARRDYDRISGSRRRTGTAESDTDCTYSGTTH